MHHISSLIFLKLICTLPVSKSDYCVLVVCNFGRWFCFFLISLVYRLSEYVSCFQTLPCSTRLCHFLSPDVSIVVDFNFLFALKVEFQSTIVET